jgi:hypothetical protein
MFTSMRCSRPTVSAWSMTIASAVAVMFRPAWPRSIQ